MSVPKLRFKDKDGKEFPKWKSITLGIISKKVISKNKDMAIKLVLTNSATKGVVKQEDFFDREIVSDTNLDSYFIINRDDFVYNPRISVTAPVGPIKRNKLETGIMSPLYTIFRFNEANLSFLESYFQTSHWHKYMKSVANCGARFDRMNITDYDFFNLPIPYPSPNEQTKIADFLTTLDTRINQQEKQCQLLEQYKKGIMQQIFSQQLRFKDDNGEEFPEWEEITLGAISKKIISKNRDMAVKIVLTNSAIKGVVRQEDFFDREIVSDNNLNNYFIINKDDFVYNPRISINAPVGPINRNKFDVGIMSPLYTVLRFNNGNLIFLENYFQTNYWHNYMKSVANSGARHDRMNITDSDFFNLPIPFPTLLEQTKIANFLTAIDDKINLAKAQLEQLNTYKKGLLQQLFI